MTADDTEFMSGLNVEGNDVRESPDEVTSLLKNTPIRWLRVHSLPTRSLDQKGNNGLSYLDGIDHLCKNGYNIVVPLDVGYTENVGKVAFAQLDRFVEESYQLSFDAAKRVAEIAERHSVQLMYGIENEFDVKSWLLQSIPNFGWRADFPTWAKLAVDFGLKYKRLNNILKAARDANASARTMANVVAVDVGAFYEDLTAMLARHARVLKEHSVVVEEIADKTIDWRAELKYLRDHLDVDLVGLDTYANYVLKYPVLGLETGGQVTEAEALTGKPVFNPEFGYTTYRTLPERLLFSLTRRPSAREMQRLFFQNTLDSIARTDSKGTFPWVLMTHTDRKASPRQEAYFGLFQMSGSRARKQPAFDLYVKWLNGRRQESR